MPKLLPAVTRHLLCLFFAIGISCAPMSCQDSNYNSGLQPGYPASGRFDGDNIVSVNLQNGNLHIEIPLYNRPGRALNETASFVYDSQDLIWNSDGIPTYPARGTVDGAGPRIVTGPAAHIEFDETTVTCENGDGGSPPTGDPPPGDGPPDGGGSGDPGSPYEQSDYIYTVYAVDIHGTRHILLPTGIFMPDITGGGCAYGRYPHQLVAADGSGWVLDLDQSQGTTKVLFDAHGNRYFFQLYDDVSTTMEDANGNVFSSSTDTMGRPPGNGYTDTQGNPNFPTITYTTPNLYQDPTGQTIYRMGPAVSKIVFANGDTYTIEYTQNLEGEVSSLTVPSGARYDFYYGPYYLFSNGRAIIEKKLTIPPSPGSTVPTVQITHYTDEGMTDPNGNDTSYSETDLPYTESECPTPTCLTYQTLIHYQGTGANAVPLESEVTTITNYAGNAVTPMPFALSIPTSTVTTLYSGGSPYVMKEKDTNYSVGPGGSMFGYTYPIYFQEPLSVTESDWGTSSPGPILRTTTYDYATPGIHMIDRPYQVTVTGPLGQTIDQYGYDESALITAGSATGWGAASTLGRGNLTSHARMSGMSTRHLLGTTTTNPVFETKQRMVYDTLGNVRQVVDGRGTITTLDYTDRFLGTSCLSLWPGQNTYAFPTTIVTAAGTTEAETEIKSYSSCTGQVVNDKSPNDFANSLPGTSIAYDNVLRPYTLTTTDGTQTQFTYYDNPINPIAQSLTAQNLQRTTYYDGLHRPAISSIAGGASVLTQYDPNGSPSIVSHPYVTGGQAEHFTHTVYDGLNRPTDEYEDSVLISHTEYTGNITDTYDERGNQHRQVTDGLGRIAKVFEPGPDGTATYETDYPSYDVAGNLLSVVQNGNGIPVSRSFTYDTESRLISANNPESGAVCYGTVASGTCTEDYDGNDNLRHKTDANGSVTTYAYDLHNRLIQKTYFVPSASGTQTACYVYSSPSVADSVGKLTSEWTQTSSVCPSSAGTSYITKRDFLAYSPAQYLLSEQQCTPAYCTPVPITANATALVYSYDPLGRITSYTNGSATNGYIFDQMYDSAGRLATVKERVWGDPLFTANGYDPSGAIKEMFLGTKIDVQRTYDSRQRITGENTLVAQ